MQRFNVTRYGCPQCKERSYWPYSTFRELIQYQTGSPKGVFSGFLVCVHCNYRNTYKTALEPWSVFDTGNPPQGILCENLFLEFLACGDKTCKFPVPLVVPKRAHVSLSVDEGLVWRSGDDLICEKSHKPKAILRLSTFLFISRPILKCPPECGELIRLSESQGTPVYQAEWPTPTWKERATCPRCLKSREFSGEKYVVWIGDKITVKE